MNDRTKVEFDKAVGAALQECIWGYKDGQPTMLISFEADLGWGVSHRDDVRYMVQYIQPIYKEWGPNIPNAPSDTATYIPRTYGYYKKPWKAAIAARAMWQFCFGVDPKETRVITNPDFAVLKVGDERHDVCILVQEVFIDDHMSGKDLATLAKLSKERTDL